MKICPNCRLKYDDKFGFCKQCGQKLELYNEQDPQNMQTPTSNVVVNNNTVNKDDSKKWIYIIGGIAVIALFAYFLNTNYSKTNKGTQILNSDSQNTSASINQNSTASTNNGLHSKKIREELEKESKAAAEIRAKGYDSTPIDPIKDKNISLPFEPKIKGYIAGTDVFMRSGPGKQYKTVGVFEKGEIVEVIESAKDSEWVLVRTENNKNVWVFTQYFAGFPVEMPSSEMSLGGIVPLNTTLRDVKNMYGEPTDKRVFEGDGLHVVTYFYGSLLKVFGRTGIPKDKNTPIIEDKLIVSGYSMKANNLATRAGFKVGMPYRVVADLYGTGQIRLDKDKGNSYIYSNKRLQSFAFYTDKSGIITEIYVGQEW